MEQYVVEVWKMKERTAIDSRPDFTETVTSSSHKEAAKLVRDQKRLGQFHMEVYQVGDEDNRYVFNDVNLNSFPEQ